MIRIRFLTLSGVSFLTIGTPLLAQEGPPPAGSDTTEDQSVVQNNAEIIVSARRREERLQDVPLVVNAVSGATIEKLNLRNTQEITSVIPGLSIGVNANGVGSSTSLRGVTHDVNVSGENGTVQYYLNDAPVPSNLALQAMYDIGQIEVLRGPQGTLRGRSTPSGAITIQPRRPDLTEAGVTVSGTIAENGVYNGQFGINVPVIADIFAIRISGLTDRNRFDQVTSAISPGRPYSKTESIRGQARLDPTDWLHAGFMYQALENDTRVWTQGQSFSNLVPGFTPGVSENISPLPPGTFVAGGFPSPRADYGVIRPGDRLSASSSAQRNKTKLQFYNWDASVDLAGQRLIYVGSKTDFHVRANSPQDQGGAFPEIEIFQRPTTSSSTVTHELRVQNQERIAGLFDYVVGYFHSTLKPQTTLTTTGLLAGFFPLPGAAIGAPAGTTALVPVVDPFPNDTAIYLPRAKTTEESYFGNLTVNFDQGTEISGGLRHIKFDDRQAGLFVSCTPEQYAAGLCVATPRTDISRTASKTIYNLAVRHRFNESLMAYASTGTSFRPPVTAIGNFSASYSPLEAAHVFAPAETSTSYEVGVKSNWFDRKLLFNLTGYYQEFKNYPYRSATGIYYININSSGQAERANFNFISAVPVRVYGLESEISYVPSEHFSISAVTNFSDSKIKNAGLACTDALNNGTGAVGSDGIPDVGIPTLADLQAAYGDEHIAECPSTDQPASFLPKWSGSVQAEGSLPLSANTDGFLRGLLSWRGATKNDPSNRFDDVDAYGIFNLYAGVRGTDGNWDVTLYAKNVFDTTKIVSASDSPYSVGVTYLDVSTFSPFGSANYESYYSGVTVTPPREVGITARFSFGIR